MMSTAAGAFFGGVTTLLQPRFYSISSSPKAHPRAIHVTCSVIEERKGTGRLHHGVASTWLGRLPAGLWHKQLSNICTLVYLCSCAL